jgi:hypothetical protein
MIKKSIFLLFVLITLIASSHFNYQLAFAGSSTNEVSPTYEYPPTNDEVDIKVTEVDPEHDTHL